MDYDGPAGQDEVVLFGGAPAAGLKHIKLVNVPINWASLHLSGLKLLHLEQIASVSAMEVIALVTQSLNLEILHLDSLGGAVLSTEQTTNEPNPSPDSRIQLTFLIRLTLRDLHLPFLKFLLSAIISPQLRFLTIDNEVDGQPTAQVLPLGLQHLRPILQSITSGAQTYEVTLSTWGFYAICIGGLDITIAFPTRVSMDHFQETLPWLSSILNIEVAGLPLHLDVDDCYPELSYLEWFTHRTNVTKFTISRDCWLGPGPERIFPSLSQPTSSISPTWLLPKLEVITIDLIWKENNSDIVDMIKKRQSHGRESTVGLDGTLPKGLREIWLVHGSERNAPQSLTDEKFLSEVVRVAEGVDVYWEGKRISDVNQAQQNDTKAVVETVDVTREETRVIMITWISERPTVDTNAREPPMHRLPPEILVEVLRHYLQLGMRLRDLDQLTLVCRRWKVIVESAAVLWGTINAAEGHSIVRKALHAAKDTPLDLTFHEYNSRIGRKTFFEAIGERVRHWRSLTVILKSVHWDFALAALEKGTAPNLEMIHLSAQYGAEMKRNTVTLFGGNPAPSQLKEVSLVHIPINLASLQLGGLRSISLWRTPSVSSADVLNVIRSSPTIESIRLRHLESLTGGAPPPQPFSDRDGLSSFPIHLGSLLHLLLEAIPVPFLNHLLSHISAPRLQTFKVGRELEAQSTAEQFLASLHHQIPTLARLTTGAQVFKVIVINLVLNEGNSETVETIEKRYSASQMSSVGLDGPLSKRLKEIWLTYGGQDDPKPPPNEGFLLEVIRAAGGADVSWAGKKIQSK
ncbi:hypothetical protein M407DRAFT_7699 [Tulasnella calospora MUT 4182]|uniref:F-box domain-containing protein n=1 Tax=Tulasnella calospora MUT 4182 TaxID=1051891 RepID=A0A0C3KYZ4_9AGAM|nr:hypothetical protein M407DRAFT_7699 [Tulasnella calospora MUT 4182]